jgi:hypothetical protein
VFAFYYHDRQQPPGSVDARGVVTPRHGYYESLPMPHARGSAPLSREPWRGRASELGPMSEGRSPDSDPSSNSSTMTLVGIQAKKGEPALSVASFRVVYDVGEGDPVVDVGAVTA